MKICYFGTSTTTVTRNHFLRTGLEQNGVEVIEVLPPAHRGLPKRVHQLLTFISLFVEAVRRDYDVLVVGYTGHIYVFLAKLVVLLKRKPLVFDAFTSSYNTLVCDRKWVREGSWKARFLHFLDRYTCRVSDLVLLDTHAHIGYFVEEFGLQTTRFMRLFIGSVPFSVPHSEEREGFTVLFFGTFIPLQGIEYIVEAASLLEGKASFRIIGSGQTYHEMLALSEQLGTTNIRFEGMRDRAYILEAMAESDIGLGIFGNTEKASRVIPHKAYEILSGDLPLLTGDSRALRELLVPGKDCLACRMADGESLARELEKAIENPGLLKEICRQGRETYLRHCTPDAVGKEFKEAMAELLKPKR